MDSGFAYVVDSPRSVEETAVALRRAVEAAKWTVLGGYDLGETLASKGFPQAERCRNLHICNAKHANAVLQGDPRVALFMPCPVLIFTVGGKARIAAMLPGTTLPKAMPEMDAESVAYVTSIDDELRAILDAAVS